MNLDVTVAICSRNRAAQLRRALESVCALVVPKAATWEVIVVDNGSSDETPIVLQEFAARLPLRRLFEPEPGVSRSRNCALEAAQGRYICWTDDDVLLNPHWLAAYLDAFNRHPDAVLFGGPIDPLLAKPVRPLFNRGKDEWPLAGPYAARSPGKAVRPLSLKDCDVPYGANLAVRVAEHRRYPFDERLGPSPFFNRLADEVDVIYRMMRHGAEGWWVPDAGVLHIIPPERQSLRYLISYYHRIGETVAWLHEMKPGDNINEIESPPAFAFKSPAQLPRQCARMLRTLVRRTGFRHGRWIGFLALYGYALGIVHHRRASRLRKPAISRATLQAESP
jgi:glycosyltransferase involved in cell wall biosynthesis